MAPKEPWPFVMDLSCGDTAESFDASLGKVESTRRSGCIGDEAIPNEGPEEDLLEDCGIWIRISEERALPPPRDRPEIPSWFGG